LRSCYRPSIPRFPKETALCETLLMGQPTVHSWSNGCWKDEPMVRRLLTRHSHRRDMCGIAPNERETNPRGSTYVHTCTGYGLPMQSSIHTEFTPVISWRPPSLFQRPLTILSMLMPKLSMLSLPLCPGSLTSDHTSPSKSNSPPQPSPHSSPPASTTAPP
jgi:hypothetical protein